MNEKWLEALKNNGRLGGIAKGLAFSKNREAIRAEFLSPSCPDMKTLAEKYNLSISTVYKYVQEFRTHRTYHADDVLKEVIKQNEFLASRIEQLKLLQRTTKNLDAL